MDKWEKLKSLIEADLSWMVHYSHDKKFDGMMSERYLKLMRNLEQEENETYESFRQKNDLR
jgi:hypothetical protein